MSRVALWHGVRIVRPPVICCAKSCAAPVMCCTKSYAGRLGPCGRFGNFVDSGDVRLLESWAPDLVRSAARRAAGLVVARLAAKSRVTRGRGVLAHLVLCACASTGTCGDDPSVLHPCPSRSIVCYHLPH